MSLPTSDEQGQHYDEQLNDAYTHTAYCFQDFTLKIGHLHPDFDAWLQEHDYQTYAFVTPFNPRSQPLPEAENVARLTQLHHLLRSAQLPFAPATGRDPEDLWPDETGVFIFNQPAADIHKIGRTFGQNAVMEGKVGGVPFLVWV